MTPSSGEAGEAAITITTTANDTSEERSAEVVIKSGSTKQTIEVKQEVAPQSNEILYTSSDGKIVEPTHTDKFGANITSNIYENGKGVITFDGNVTSIGETAFCNCSTLQKISIPEGVTTIGTSAFNNCITLEKVSIPESVTSIEKYAFAFNPALRNITIPESITLIESQTFSGCTALENITIPERVISIGNSVFYGCTSLKSINIPNNVTAIGEGVFSGCSSLSAFYGKYASADNRCIIIDGILKYFAPYGIKTYTIPEGIIKIEGRVFISCSSLTSVNIPDGVTSIGDYTFSSCI